MSQFFEGQSVQLQKHEGGAAVEVSADSLNGKYVLFYFSAHWCPPCRGFTPTLAQFYNDNHEKLNFELVFLSSDKDQKSFNEYWGEMPWLALPFTNQELKNTLAKKFKVTGIPMLVVLNPDGSVATSNGRAGVQQHPDGAGFPWAQ